MEISKQKSLLKRHQMNVHIGQIDVELEKKFKKHRNYCNKLIKRAVREKAGTNISNVSNVKQVWKSINDILKPENIAKNSIKIQLNNDIIEDPQQLAEEFNIFFKKKVENLADGIKKNLHIDPVSHLREKMSGLNLKFKLRTVSEKEISKILKAMKSKNSHGYDGITSEVLKLGANVLVVPLTFIVNSSIFNL